MKFLALALIAQAALATSAFAQAQEPQCLQVENLICGPRAPSVVARATGDVSIIRQAVSTRAGQGSRLAAGDRVIVNQGSAVIALGPRCVVQYPANSAFTVVQRGELLCVETAAAIAGGPLPAAPIVGAFVGAFAVGVLVLSDDGNDNNPGPVSP